ncbi:MAG: S8 family serine peptidase [Sarcina sp.]
MWVIIIDVYDFRTFVTGVPKELFDDVTEYVSKFEGINDVIEFVILFGDNAELVEQSTKLIGGSFENLGFGFGIVSISNKEIDKVLELKGIQYIEIPKVFTTNGIQNNTISCIPSVWENYNLSGKGTLIGFIDTGIDYMHPSFRNKDGSTRIKYIYDLHNKKVYSEDQINLAIKNESPLTVVPTQDYIGHGTAVASVAAGGGKDRNYYGPAYEASIIMVKITSDGVLNFTLSTQIMRGLKFLIDKSNELKMPLIVNISLSSNDGAHNGTTLIEKYINEYAQIQRVGVVVAAGNEGGAAHHYSADVNDNKDIFINVATGEKKIIIFLYKPLLADINILVTAPTGEKSEIIKVEKATVRGLIGEADLTIYYSGPKPFDKAGEVIISIRGKNESIAAGQWALTIKNETTYGGIMDMWLPISAAVNKNTKFLEPDPYNTLGIPATVESVIAVGSYNTGSDNYSYFSGRGATRDEKCIKPDILAPGENVVAAVNGGEFDIQTGTSVAAPRVAGVCALILEWGLVKKNDMYLFGEKLKYYLVKGAKRNRKARVYPSRTYGYGYLCLAETFSKLVPYNEKFDNVKIGSLSNIMGNENTISEKKEGEILEMPKKRREQQIKETANNNSSNIICAKVPLKTTKQHYLEKGYIDFLVQYEGDLIKKIQSINDIASAFIIDESYAIVSVKEDKFGSVSAFKEIVYIDSGGVYTLESINPAEASQAVTFHFNPYLNLTGRGTLIGIVDTGIDFTNDDFIKADNTSNIIRIWDQSLENNLNDTVIFGAEYTNEDINNALKAKREGKDPYEIVKSKDVNGHGTAVSALIAGRGNNNSAVGVAIDSEIAMVKLKTADEAFEKFYASDGRSKYQYRNTDILLGVKYLFDLSKRLNRPMVIYIPLGTTVGGHDGSSILEHYIDGLSDSSGILFINSTGNEGIGENHTSGKIEKVGDVKRIELEIGETQTSIFMTIYAKAPDRFGLSVISPSGDAVKNINPKQKDGVKLNFVYEGTAMNVMFIEPSELTGDEVIVIRADGLKPGVWIFELIGEYVVHGYYDSWLLQRELLDENTKFLSATPNTTMTIPSTSYNIITVASYNQNNNAMLSSSGRGPTRDGRQCPLIAAGGVNALVSTPGNTRRLVSGGSVASAIVAGCCLQLLQWGIVEGNDRTMYSTKVQTYLMRGTKQRLGDEYPNPNLGYGTIDMKILFENIRGSAIGSPKNFTDADFVGNGIRYKKDDEDRNDDKYEEFLYRNIFIRKPLK